MLLFAALCVGVVSLPAVSNSICYSANPNSLSQVAQAGPPGGSGSGMGPGMGGMNSGTAGGPGMGGSTGGMSSGMGAGPGMGRGMGGMRHMGRGMGARTSMGGMGPE